MWIRYVAVQFLMAKHYSAAAINTRAEQTRYPHPFQSSEQSIIYNIFRKDTIQDLQGPYKTTLYKRYNTKLCMPTYPLIQKYIKKYIYIYKKKLIQGVPELSGSLMWNFFLNRDFTIWTWVWCEYFPIQLYLCIFIIKIKNLCNIKWQQNVKKKFFKLYFNTFQMANI